MNKKNVFLIFVFAILTSPFLETVKFENIIYIKSYSYIQFAFGLSILYAGIFSFINNHKQPLIKIPLNRIDIMILFISIYVLARYILTPIYQLLFDKIIFFLIVFISYFYIKITCQTNKSQFVLIILYMIIGIGLVQSFYGILQWLLVMPNFFQFKMGGSFGNPGVFANFLIIPYILSLGLFFIKKNKKI